MDAEREDRDDNQGARRARPDRSRAFEIVVGASAILVSVVSLVVAMSANRTQERMLAASIWPSLIAGTSNVTADGLPQISLDLLNRGTGPARVRWAQVLYDGTPVRDSRELMARCCGLEQPVEDYRLISSGIQHRVIGADEWVALLRVPQPEAPWAPWGALDRERHKIELRACYCSVLDDCWLLDSARDEPEPVARCPAAPAVLWNG